MSLKLLHVCSVAPLGEMQSEEPPSPFEASFLVVLSGNPGFLHGKLSRLQERRGGAEGVGLVVPCFCCWL